MLEIPFVTSVLLHRVCAPVAISKSKSSKIFLFNALRPLVAIFLFALAGMHYQSIQILHNVLLQAYSATANAVFLLCSSASVVPRLFCLIAGVYGLSE
jgi:hypothetical protein